MSDINITYEYEINDDVMIITNLDAADTKSVRRKELMYLAIGDISADDTLIRVEVIGLDGRGLESNEEVGLFFSACNQALAKTLGGSA